MRHNMRTALQVSLEWQTDQGLSSSLQPYRTSSGLENGIAMLVASSLHLFTAVAPEKHKALRKAAIRGSATEGSENARSQVRAKTVEVGSVKFLGDPSLWWHKRKTKRNPKYPGFVHAATACCEALWIDSCFFSKWVHPELNSLQDSRPPPGRAVRAHYRNIAGASCRSCSIFPGAGRGGNAVRKTWPQRNEFFWTKLISEQTKCGQGREALRIYKEMREEGVTPKTYTFVAALKACSKLTDLEAGKEIHAHVIESGVQSHTFVANTLVDMYAKCGSMVDARQVFERMLHRDVVSWNSMIMGYAQRGERGLALQLYASMQHEGFAPDAWTFVAALKACGNLAAQEEGKQVDTELVRIGCLEKGRAIHSQVAESGFESHIFVASTLIDMYAKCGSMVDARQVFERMPHRDVVSWNAMIMGYAQEAAGSALQLYARMRHEGFTPNALTFVAALKACGSLAAQGEGKQVNSELVEVGCLEMGRIIHSQVAKSGFESHTFVANTLVDMYAKCGSMVDAQQVFERMPHHDVVSWNALIMGYAQTGEGELALQLYASMQHEGFAPDTWTFVAALKACGSLAAQEEGKQVDGELVKIECLDKGRAIHSQAAKSGFDSDIFVASTLVDMYAKCECMANAHQVFEKMAYRNVVSWNAMIMGYAQKEAGELALQLYARMQDEGFTPNARTFVAALKACGSLAAQEEGTQIDGESVKIECLEMGRTIHSQVANSGFELDIFVASTLVDMYVKCGSMADARWIFERMPHRDVVSWTAMIMGYAQREEGDLALQLYARMQHEGFMPDAWTFVAALKACSNLAAQEEGKEVDGELVKTGYLEEGRAIHSQIAKCGFDSNIFVSSTLLDMYAKCGSMKDARRVFERMPHRDVVSWNAMIMGYAQRGEGELALELYTRMQHEGFKPDASSFVTALKACGSLASLETGKKVHAEIHKAGLEGDTFLATCLVGMYGKCGSMVDAQQLFDASPVRDVVIWSALIAGYSHQGDSEHVFDLFERMQQEGVQPVGTTFLSVLTVCSHAGLVAKGQKYFEAMCLEYGVTPACKHYNCMVDLLGRAGQLDEAVAMVKEMPYKPDMVTWMTILGACRKWKNVEVGWLAFECAVRLDKKKAAAYVLMTNIYVSAHMWDESAKIQAMRTNAQAWKKPGQCWWTDSAGIVHTFLVGDRSHPQSKDIFSKLKDLSGKMEEEGHVPNLDNVLHDISDDEKEDALCGHSEKLAIACALINTPPGTAIRVAKNLRVCDDCHNATILISKIEQRAIICRDASRFHVYKEGKCSCGDFW